MAPAAESSIHFPNHWSNVGSHDRVQYKSSHYYWSCEFAGFCNDFKTASANYAKAAAFLAEILQICGLSSFSPAHNIFIVVSVWIEIHFLHFLLSYNTRKPNWSSTWNRSRSFKINKLMKKIKKLENDTISKQLTLEQVTPSNLAQWDEKQFFAYIWTLLCSFSLDVKRSTWKTP